MSIYHKSVRDIRPTSRVVIDAIIDPLFKEVKRQKESCSSFKLISTEAEHEALYYLYYSIIHAAKALHKRAFDWVIQPVEEIAERLSDQRLIDEIHSVRAGYE